MQLLEKEFDIMKKNIVKGLFVCVVSAGLYGCEADWLKPEPLSFFSPENVYTDRAGFESLLVTMRKDLRNENTGSMNYLIMETASSDLASP